MKPIALMIDGINTHATSRFLGFDIDYRSVLSFFGDDDILRAFYFTTIMPDRSGQESTLRPLLDWLDYNGFQLVTKPVKEYVNAEGRRKVKGDMSVEMSVAAMELAPHISRLVLFTGDGDLRALVASVQRQGVRVTVVSSIRTQPSAIADELRRQADTFIDLDDIREVIGRDQAPVSPPPLHAPRRMPSFHASNESDPARPVADRESLKQLRAHFAKSPATAPTS